MVDPNQAIRKRLAELKKEQLRLERMLEIGTGKRGIEGAPADGAKPAKKSTPPAEEDKEGEAAARRLGVHPKKRKPGELKQEVSDLMADGKPRTAQEVADVVGGGRERLYRVLDNLPGVKQTGRRDGARVYKHHRRELKVVPGVGASAGRLV